MPGSQQNKARRQLAAILSADAVGYSRRMAEDEAATAQVLRSHRDTIAGYVREHRGRVVNAVGDNLLAEFASAVDAVACALDVQTELARREAGPESDVDFLVELERDRTLFDLSGLILDLEEALGHKVHVVEISRPSATAERIRRDAVPL